MQTYMVGYDLNKSDKDYKDLIDAIKGIANGYWHHLDSTWFIKSDLDVTQIRDQLKQHIDSNDELLVLRVTSAPWAGTGFSNDAYSWLKDSL